MSTPDSPNMTTLRPAGYNERRYITRQSLGYYRTLAIGGVYTFDRSSSAEITQQTFVPALKHCIQVHPLLSAAIEGQDSEAPVFVRPSVLNLEDHVEIIDPSDLGSEASGLVEKELVHRATVRTLDMQFSNVETTPPWKIVVLPLPNQHLLKQRLLILFAYYHSHGDGKSALAFHKTFLQGLNLTGNDNDEIQDFLCQTPSTPLPPSIEQAGDLKISWSYLLGPLFGAYLPEVVTKSLGLRASTTPKSTEAWKGVKVPFNHDSFESGLDFFSISDKTMQATLQLCRQHDAKFTGLLHQLIVRALSELLPANTPVKNFIAVTVVDLRHLLTNIGADDMTSGPTATFELFPRTTWKNWTTQNPNSPIWTAARETTQNLVECASSLHDQPIGLLSYLSKFRPWMQSEAEKERDSSYEISNLGVFAPEVGEAKGAWSVESMLFTQPANVVGSCLAFNVVTRKGGDTTISLTWQKGTLGVSEEQAFAERVCRLISEYFEEVV